MHLPFLPLPSQLTHAGAPRWRSWRRRLASSEARRPVCTAEQQERVVAPARSRWSGRGCARSAWISGSVEVADQRRVKPLLGDSESREANCSAHSGARQSAAYWKNEWIAVRRALRVLDAAAPLAPSLPSSCKTDSAVGLLSLRREGTCCRVAVLIRGARLPRRSGYHRIRVRADARARLHPRLGVEQYTPEALVVGCELDRATAARRETRRHRPQGGPHRAPVGVERVEQGSIQPARRSPHRRKTIRISPRRPARAWPRPTCTPVSSSLRTRTSLRSPQGLERAVGLIRCRRTRPRRPGTGEGLQPATGGSASSVPRHRCTPSGGRPSWFRSRRPDRRLEPASARLGERAQFGQCGRIEPR